MPELVKQASSRASVHRRRPLQVGRAIHMAAYYIAWYIDQAAPISCSAVNSPRRLRGDGHGVVMITTMTQTSTILLTTLPCCGMQQARGGGDHGRFDQSPQHTLQPVSHSFKPDRLGIEQACGGGGDDHGRHDQPPAGPATRRGLQRPQDLGTGGGGHRCHRSLFTCHEWGAMTNNDRQHLPPDGVYSA